MRIAELFFFMDMGGVERTIANLANALPAEAFDVSVIVSHHGGMMEKQISPRVSFVRLDAGSRMPQLIELLRGFDVAHVNTTNENPFFTWAAALSDVPVIVDTIHAPIDGNPYASYTDRTICVSRFGASTQPRPRQTRVIYNAVASTGARPGITDRVGRPIVMLEMRRPDKEMRFSLLDLAPRFAGRPALQDVECWILGMDGVSSGNLRFLGKVADPWSWLARADFLVHFPAFEALPNGVLEAMGHGAIPVVAPVGGIPEIVSDAVNGVCRDVASADELLGALEGLCVSYRTERPRFERLRQAGYETVRTRFSIEGMRDGYAEIFHALASGKRNGARRGLPRLLGGGAGEGQEREFLSLLERYCFERPRALQTLQEGRLSRFAPLQEAFLSSLLAQEQLKRGSAEPARVLLDRAVLLIDQDPYLHVLCAQARWQTGDRAGASAHFEQALGLDPDNVWLGMETLQCLLDTGQVPRARARIGELLVGVPQDHQAWRILNGIERKLAELIDHHGAMQ